MNRYVLSDDLKLIEKAYFECILKLGKGKQYGIWCDDIPFVLIEVSRTSNPFDAAYVFGNYLYIGNDDELIVVALDTLNCEKVACEMYFGYFCEHEDLLFVATGVNLMCFQNNGKLKWQTKMLAVDGVTFSDKYDGRTITVNCCMDPYPAIWCEKVVSVENGEILNI